MLDSENHFLNSKDFPFKEVLQHFSQSGRTGFFEMLSGEKNGAVYLRNGMIVHSEWAGHGGKKCFFQCLALPELQYSWHENQVTSVATLNSSAQDLLLEEIMLLGEGKTWEDLEDDLDGQGKTDSETRELKQGSTITFITLSFSSNEIEPFHFMVPDKETFIGRGEDNDLVIEDTSMSRRHASIQAAGETLLVTDLGSKNGTYINSQPVTQGMAKNNQVITLGEVQCRVSVSIMPKTNNKVKVV